MRQRWWLFIAALGLLGMGRAPQRWQEEQRQPEPILEVTLHYAGPTERLVHSVFAIRKVKEKSGFAPALEPITEGCYSLIETDAEGNTLVETCLRPPVIYDPPPRTGEAVGKPPTIESQDVVVALPFPDAAVELGFFDLDGTVIDLRDLRFVHFQIPPGFHIPTGKSHHKTFRPSARGSGVVAEAATDGLDLTFVSDKYGADENHFNSDVDHAVGYLLSMEPYKARASQLVFHRYFSTLDHSCVHSVNMDRLITCNTATVLTDLHDHAVPYDKVLVLVNDPNYGGSGGGTVAVSYNGDARDTVAAHEFGGHTIAGLIDQYLLYGTCSWLANREESHTCWSGNPPATWTLTPIPNCNCPGWYADGHSIMEALAYPFFSPANQRGINLAIDLYAGPLFYTMPVTQPQPQPTQDTVAPSVTLTGVTDGQLVKGKIPLTVTATDTVGIVKIELWINATLRASGTTSPLAWTWHVWSRSYKPGAYTLTAKAWDAAGNIGQTVVKVTK